MTSNTEPPKGTVVVAVGTLNPGKIEAVEQAFRQWWLACGRHGDSSRSGDSTNPSRGTGRRGVAAVRRNPLLEFKPVRVESGVSDQPMDLEETRQGAINRAQNALSSVPGADLGVGLESGVMTVGGEMYDVCLTAIVSKKGYFLDGENEPGTGETQGSSEPAAAVGISGAFVLPAAVANGVRDPSIGYNAGVEALGIPPDPNGLGLLHHLSFGELNRISQTVQSIQMALVKLFL
jgi:non-canonical (house-cleaning) NTP pyrophosphatase